MAPVAMRPPPDIPEEAWLAPARPAREELRERGSRFLADVRSVGSEAEATAHRAGLEAEFPRATHHCWAWRLRLSGGVVGRSGDAGEPAGTAGAPILRAIEAAGLEGTSVIVVRWFGGIKLGVGPLARAYRAAAAAALAQAGSERRHAVRLIRLRFPWPASGEVRRALEQAAAETREEHPGQDAEIVAAVPVSSLAALLLRLTDVCRGNLEVHELGLSTAPVRE
jgi:putative IMPACT (imprinted ancient) family translation regulator